MRVILPQAGRAIWIYRRSRWCLTLTGKFSDTASLNAATIRYTLAAFKDIPGESICASVAR
ncbi:hypothetical protein CJP72_17985 [Citrobacter sp. NCU1]|nr:hypothetical protein [Citrobacter sp. NCU1]